jgi:uncharacterized protein
MDDPDDQVEYTTDDVFRTAVVFEIALGVIAIILGLAIGPDARLSIPKLEPSQYANIGWGCLYGFVATIPILIAIELLKRIPWKPIQELEALTDDGMIKTLLKLRLSELAVISLCAGVGEELLFRGWLLPWLAGDSLGATPIDMYTLDYSSPELWAAIIGSSISFGLVHPITKLYVVLAALMGLYFAFLLIATGNLIVPIVAHSAYDAAQLYIASRQQAHQKLAA